MQELEYVEAEKASTQARLKEYAAELEALETQKTLIRSETGVAQKELASVETERKERFPGTKHIFGLYASISNIEWDYNSKEAIRGSKCTPHL